MQIVVPMSGFGERFRRAGYTVPKPLINVEGKPIIAHVIDMFPGETDFVFICNQDHLDHPDYAMASILQHYCPSGRILGIAPHRLGPVHAVQQAAHLIDPNRPVVVNYCDFTCYWDWAHFRAFVAATACDGAIPAYKGFHPHLLGPTNYAYMRESGGWVSDIQEKKPFTDDRTNEFASSGTYYFASGSLMQDALRRTVEDSLSVNDEYYVSLAYKPLLDDKRAIAVYPLQHFMQWGTPEDVKDYNGWSSTFRALADAPQHIEQPRGSLVIPMAGLGQRFVNEGYTTPKPLIPVSGKPMVAQAAYDLPKAKHQAFVLRADMPGHERITQALHALFDQTTVEIIPMVTEGQACTALLGLDALERDVGVDIGPITFGACDNGALYKPEILADLLADDSVDVLVWAVRGHANAIRFPRMFGWIDEKDGVVRGISVKEPLAAPETDPIVLGTFTFRHAAHFREVVNRLKARDGRVNGEFYIDSCINDALALGLNVRIFEVDHYIGWGTPNDLKTFEYWQSCFHKWQSHPYRLELDSRIPPEAVSALEDRYKPILPDATEWTTCST